MLNIEEKDIMKKWKYENGDLPLLTIRCLAFNHEKYIEDTLVGFLSQKTDFPFEIVIHDDASTDRTTEIIKKYEKKYPNIMKPIYETENQYSKHDGSLKRIVDSNMRGKYVAFCEGDDYWKDENKLQKQVDFLETHSDYGMCYTNFDIKNEVRGTYLKDLFITDSGFFKSEYTLEEWIMKKGYVAPMTWVYKREIYDKYEKIESCDGSFVLFTHFLASTKVKCLVNETTAVYRVIRESASHSMNIEKIYKRERSLRNTCKNLIKKYKLDEKLNNRIDDEFYSKCYYLIYICGSKEERALCRKYNKNYINTIMYYISYFKLGRFALKKMYTLIKYVRSRYITNY